jgi:hypothetical protein
VPVTVTGPDTPGNYSEPGSSLMTPDIAADGTTETQAACSASPEGRKRWTLRLLA